MRRYRYVGSKRILDELPRESRRVAVYSGEDVMQWIRDSHQTPEIDGGIVATFVVDVDQRLWINDRRSEHVLCAAGRDVLSAGEMTFRVEGALVQVSEVTNQSTGYCPEPESWWAVDAALNAAHIAHPDDFTTAYVFRRCEACGSTNIVKDNWFECDVCGAPLPPTWNYESVSSRG